MSLNLWVIPVNIRRAQSVGNGDSLEAKSKAWGIFTKSLSIITEYLIYFKTVDGTSDLMIAGRLAESELISDFLKKYLINFYQNWI